MSDVSSPTVLQWPGFRFDVVRRELSTDGGTPVPLRDKCLRVLECLAARPSEVIEREALMRHVWPRVVVTDDSLVQCIGELRRVLRDDAHALIVTVPKRGYRFVVPEAKLAAAAPAPPRFDQQVRFATTTDGVRIAFAISGKGMPMIRAGHWMTHLDHDWCGAAQGPRIRAWSEHFRLVRYDMRGCGLSDRAIPEATFEADLRDLEAVADAAGFDRFVLLGTSGGAPKAIRYAARHPERVALLLVLGGCALGPMRRHPAPTQENADAFLRIIEEAWGRENPMSRQIMTSVMYPGATAEQARAFNDLQRAACSGARAVEILRTEGRIDVTADLADIACPTLVMHNPRDAAVPFDEGRRIAAGIAGSEFATFDSDNHMPMSHEPAFDTLTRTVVSFVRRHARAMQRTDPRDARRSQPAALTLVAPTSRRAG